MRKNELIDEDIINIFGAQEAQRQACYLYKVIDFYIRCGAIHINNINVDNIETKNVSELTDILNSAYDILATTCLDNINNDEIKKKVKKEIARQEEEYLRWVEKRSEKA